MALLPFRRNKQETEIDNDAIAEKVMELMQLKTNNASINEGIRGQIVSLMSGGYDFADTLHNVYFDFGYPAQLTFTNFWNMYRRFGIAKNIVELPTDAGWSTPPIVLGNSVFNGEFKKLVENRNFWQRMKGLDTRQRVGRYGGMFMRVRDNKMPSEELTDKQNGLGSLVELMPLYESQLDVVESDTNPKSDNYGQPIMFQYSGSVPGSRNEDARNTVNIHASRVVIASEDADNGWIYGISSLEAAYNSLMDLRKIAGAGGEGFYKNAAQSILFKLMDGASANVSEDLLEKFSEKYDEFARNRQRRGMFTPGLEPMALQADLANPKDFFMNSLNDVAAASKIPATILIGQQTGRLASSEDSRNFLAGIQSRRMNFMTEMTTNVIDWLIQFGILPQSNYTIEWDDLLARSDDEKLVNADTMASINEKQFKSGGGIPFNEEEIREAAGFEPEEDVEPGDEEIEEDEDMDNDETIA